MNAYLERAHGFHPVHVSSCCRSQERGFTSHEKIRLSTQRTFFFLTTADVTACLTYARLSSGSMTSRGHTIVFSCSLFFDASSQALPPAPSGFPWGVRSRHGHRALSRNHLNSPRGGGRRLVGGAFRQVPYVVEMVHSKCARLVTHHRHIPAARSRQGCTRTIS